MSGGALLLAAFLLPSVRAAFTCASGYNSCPDDNVQVGEERHITSAVVAYIVSLTAARLMTVEVFLTRL